LSKIHRRSHRTKFKPQLDSMAKRLKTSVNDIIERCIEQGLASLRPMSCCFTCNDAACFKKDNLCHCEHASKKEAKRAKACGKCEYCEVWTPKP
jgi:hypothetical protein